MTRSELIYRLQNRFSSMPLDLVSAATKLTFKILSDNLIKKERVEIRDFGSFQIKERLPRTSRNPKTGETIQTEKKLSVHFKAGKEMRERVNQD